MPLAYLSYLAAGPCPSQRMKVTRMMTPGPEAQVQHSRRSSPQVLRWASIWIYTTYFLFFRPMVDWSAIILWKHEDRNRLNSFTEKQNARCGFSLLPYVEGIEIKARKKHVGRPCRFQFSITVGHIFFIQWWILIMYYNVSSSTSLYLLLIACMISQNFLGTKALCAGVLHERILICAWGALDNSCKGLFSWYLALFFIKNSG